MSVGNIRKEMLRGLSPAITAESTEGEAVVTADRKIEVHGKRGELKCPAQPVKVI